MGSLASSLGPDSSAGIEGCWDGILAVHKHRMVIVSAEENKKSDNRLTCFGRIIDAAKFEDIHHTTKE